MNNHVTISLPLMGIENHVSGLAGRDFVGLLITPHGDRKLSHNLNRASPNNELITPHGDRKRLQRHRAQLRGRNLITPHGDRKHMVTSFSVNR